MEHSVNWPYVLIIVLIYVGLIVEGELHDLRRRVEALEKGKSQDASSNRAN